MALDVDSGVRRQTTETQSKRDAERTLQKDQAAFNQAVAAARGQPLETQLISTPTTQAKSPVPDTDDGPQTYGTHEPALAMDDIRARLAQEQKDLLGGLIRNPRTDSQATRQQEQIAEITNSIFTELDYATVRQAVPDAEPLIKDIRARAPDDATFQRAVDDAKAQIEESWRLQGRTSDQIGEIIKAGEAGDFTKVRELAKQQLTTVANELGPDAKPEAVQAALSARSAVYTTYITNDPRYTQAITDAKADVTREILVERPIASVLAVANAGGENWQEDSIAKLREVTSIDGHTPDQVLAIMSDARIEKVVRQSLRHADSLDAPDEGQVWGDWQAGDTIFNDLSAIYNNTLYADNGTPGKGKQLVDEAAQFIVDNTRNTSEPSVLALNMNNAFAEAIEDDGNAALALAIVAKAGDNHPVFSGYPPMLETITDGIEKYATTIEELAQKANDASAFYTNPYESVAAGKMNEEDSTRFKDNLIAASDPADIKKSADAIRAVDTSILKAQSVQFAMNAYAPALQGMDKFDEGMQALSKLPQQDDIPAAPGIKETKSWWLQRSVRAMVVEGISNTGEWALSKKFPSSSNTQYAFGSKGAFDRLIGRSASTYLFARNMASSWENGDALSRGYALAHAGMMVGEAVKFVYGDVLFAKLLGDKLGKMPDPKDPSKMINKTPADVLLEKATKGKFGSNKFLHWMAKGLYKDPLDLAYLPLDVLSAADFFTGFGEGDVDIVQGFAYTLGVASDAAFLTGAGALKGGKAAWTWVGLVLVVAGATISYLDNLHDYAHANDEGNAKAWQLLGVEDPKVAEALGKGRTFGDEKSLKNAGPALIDFFLKAGYTHTRAAEFINMNWTPEQADKIATYIKDEIGRDDFDDAFTMEDYDKVVAYAEKEGIAFPVVS